MLSAVAGHNLTSVQFAARFNGSVIERLRTRASREAKSQRQLAERYIDEGLRMDDHPGIVFRPGPMGRRAGLAAGPDVWEIVAALKQLQTRGEAAVRDLSKLLELGEGQLQTALGYYGDFGDEVDEVIRRNEEEAARAEAAWRRRQTALG